MPVKVKLVKVDKKPSETSHRGEMSRVIFDFAATSKPGEVHEVTNNGQPLSSEEVKRYGEGLWQALRYHSTRNSELKGIRVAREDGSVYLYNEREGE